MTCKQAQIHPFGIFLSDKAIFGYSYRKTMEGNSTVVHEQHPAPCQRYSDHPFLETVLDKVAAVASLDLLAGSLHSSRLCEQCTLTRVPVANARSAPQVTGLSERLVRKTAEPMQVLLYPPHGGHYSCHHDTVPRWKNHETHRAFAFCSAWRDLCLLCDCTDLHLSCTT